MINQKQPPFWGSFVAKSQQSPVTGPSRPPLDVIGRACPVDHRFGLHHCTSDYICIYIEIPVVPHKAVAEVSRIGNL